MNASDVPDYPERHEWLMHVRRWPPTRVMDGTTYVLEFSTQDSDVGHPDLKTLADIPPGADYGAHYVTYDGNRKRSGGYGPSYFWRSDSTLRERYYVTRQKTQMWQYSRYANLERYEVDTNDSTLGLSRAAVAEWFGGQGELIACIAQGKCYWKGAEIHRDSLYPNLRQEWKRIGWTRPLSGAVLSPCSVPSGVETGHWRTERLDTRFTFRMPVNFVVDTTAHWKTDEDDIPLPRIWTDGERKIEVRPGIWDTGPLQHAKALSLTYSECSDTLGGVPLRLATSYSPSESRYYAAAVPADSVFPHLGILRTAIIATSPDSAGQNLLWAVIRTLRIEPEGGGK